MNIIFCTKTETFNVCYSLASASLSVRSVFHCIYHALYVTLNICISIILTVSTAMLLLLKPLDTYYKKHEIAKKRKAYKVKETNVS